MTKPNLLAYRQSRREYDRGMNQFVVDDSAIVVLGITEPGAKKGTSSSGPYLKLESGIWVKADVDSHIGGGKPYTKKPILVDQLSLADDFTVIRSQHIGDKLLELAYPHEHSPALSAATLACIAAFQQLDLQESAERLQMD